MVFRLACYMKGGASMEYLENLPLVKLLRLADEARLLERDRDVASRKKRVSSRGI